MSVDIVNDITPRVQYTASAAQTDFDYTFPIFTDADLVVDVDGTTQALTTDYTVTGEGEDTGGTVTFLVAMTGGEVVTIYRDIAIERITDFQQNGRFSSSSFNDELDKITMILQQLEAADARALRVSLTDSTSDSDMQLPAPASRAEKFLYFNAAGNPEMATGAVAGSVLSQSTISTVLYPQTTSEANAGVTPVNYFIPDEGDVRRYQALSTLATEAAPGITAACAVVRQAQFDRKPDTTSTPGPSLKFGGGRVYKTATTIWLGTADTTLGTVAAQHIRNIDLDGSTIIGATSGQPVIDWCGGYEGAGRIWNGKIVGSASSSPNIGVLLARTSEADEGGGVNAQNADPRWFVDVQIIGHFTLACLYDYASELLKYTRGKLWNYYSGGAPALIITNDNVRYAATSPNVTLSDAAGGSITAAQSCIDFKFWGVDIQNKAAALGSYNGNNFQASCIEGWGWTEALFDACFINSPSVDNHHLCYSAENASIQPNRIVFTNGSFHSDNGTGASIKCAGTHGSLTVTNNRNVYNDLVNHSTGQITRLVVFGNDTNDTVKAATLVGAHLIIQDEITVTSGFSGFLQTTGSGTVSLPASASGTWVSHIGARQSLGKSGTATLSGGTASVSFGTNEPDGSYQITLSGNASETFRWASKAVGGFTINSSNAGSTASVDWAVSRGA